MSEFTTILDNFFSTVGGVVWGAPMLIMLVGTGIWLTFALRGLQFRKLGYALKLVFTKQKDGDKDPGDITPFQALMTSLSATVGTGNIAGVATAIAAGGPGALFWMWMTGLVGMATKYSEAVLAVKFRTKDKRGFMCGGPMYYISKGTGWKWLGVAFALFASIAAFGIGNMVQSNSVADAVRSTFNISPAVTGLILMGFTASVILGGIKSIGRVTSILVPVMIFFYISAAMFIIFKNITEIPDAFALIIRQAFTPTAAGGGFLGSTVMLTVRMGVARGVFSNESGLGSTPIAAAAARTKHPVLQALITMTQTFIDTLVVCTMTGLVIILSGVWDSGRTGADLTASAFQLGIFKGDIIVTVGLILFAYSTMLGWCYYGEKSIEFLLGEKVVKFYRYAFVVFIGIGAVSKLELVWNISDVFNGLMAFPNLVGIIFLTPVILKETRHYFTEYLNKK